MNNIRTILDTMEYGPAPEDDKPAIAWLESHSRRFGHFIDGSFVEGSRHFPTANPSNGEKLAEVAAATADEVNAAANAARRALAPCSSATSPARCVFSS